MVLLFFVHVEDWHFYSKSQHFLQNYLRQTREKYNKMFQIKSFVRAFVWIETHKAKHRLFEPKMAILQFGDKPFCVAITAGFLSRNHCKRAKKRWHPIFAHLQSSKATRGKSFPAKIEVSNQNHDERARQHRRNINMALGLFMSGYKQRKKRIILTSSTCKTEIRITFPDSQETWTLFSIALCFTSATWKTVLTWKITEFKISKTLLLLYS